jgi:hypothetical protein
LGSGKALTISNATTTMDAGLGTETWPPLYRKLLQVQLSLTTLCTTQIRMTDQCLIAHVNDLKKLGTKNEMETIQHSQRDSPSRH